MSKLTAVMKIKKMLDTDVYLGFLKQKDVERIKWYIDTYFIEMGRSQIIDAWLSGVENKELFVSKDQYYTQNFKTD